MTCNSFFEHRWSFFDVMEVKKCSLKQFLTWKVDFLHAMIIFWVEKLFFDQIFMSKVKFLSFFSFSTNFSWNFVNFFDFLTFFLIFCQIFWFFVIFFIFDQLFMKICQFFQFFVKSCNFWPPKVDFCQFSGGDPKKHPREANFGKKLEFTRSKWGFFVKI